MIEKEKINPTATGTEVPSYGLFGALASNIGSQLARNGGLFNQAMKNSTNTFGAVPKFGGGIFNNIVRGGIA
ncbi:MAG: hypothetical protein ACO21T_13795, partial [Alphaproteobacteria bacterium]